MKKTCDKCKALEEGKCSLGYEMKEVFRNTSFSKMLHDGYKPLEECPKPLSTKQFAQLLSKGKRDSLVIRY